MKIRIKSKLYLGFGFFFFTILLIWIMGAFYINKLANESKNIIKDNYESIGYTKNMLQVLNDIKDQQISYLFYDNKFFDSLQYNENQKTFNYFIENEKKNITEIDEKETVHNLVISFRSYINDFDKLRNNSNLTNSFYFTEILPQYNDAKNKILQISDINMQAIVRKSNQTQHSADNAFIYISLVGTFFSVITLTLFFNYPGYIADPIRELTESIKQIANKNYKERLFFKSNDEFNDLSIAFNEMAQKLDEYENSNLSKIISEKKRIETIINNLHDPLLVFDENNIILFSNNAASEILSLHKDEIIGKYAPDIALNNDLLQNIIKDIKINYKNMESKPLKIFANNKASFFSKEVYNIEINNSNNEIYNSIGYVLILRNVTQFQEMSDAKTNFIATISHELKTPISSVRLNIKLLEDKRIGELNEEQTGIVQTIKDETNRLLKITSELLDMAQVETGKINLSIKEVQPVHIIQYAYEVIKVQAMQKEILIHIDASENLSAIYADFEKTIWVMINLLTNAIRHSKNNSSIIINAMELDAFIVFSVKDFGEGISSEFVDKIFDKFYKVPGISQTGTGLGLAISKEFINAQNGKIWVESEVNVGSTFYFNLPKIKKT